jgi:hypothetical protein
MKNPSSTSRRGKQISGKAASTSQFSENPVRIGLQKNRGTAKDVAGKQTASRPPDRLVDHRSRSAIALVDKPLMDHGEGLPELVWKYFDAEIREALIEVQKLPTSRKSESVEEGNET